MTRAKSSFRQSDVTRAIKAAQLAGMNVVSVEIDKEGKIRIIGEGAAQEPDKANPWDEV